MSKTLVFTGTVTPYFEGDVATFTDEEAEALLAPVVTGDNGKAQKLEVKCEVYDPKKHAHLWSPAEVKPEAKA